MLVFPARTQVCKEPIAAVALMQHSQQLLGEPSLYAEEKLALLLPNHLSLLHRVACEQPGLIPQVWKACTDLRTACALAWVCSACCVNRTYAAPEWVRCMNSVAYGPSAAAVTVSAFAPCRRQVLGVLRSVLTALGHNRQELSKSVLAFLVSLLVSGAADAALAVAVSWSDSADPSLIRHFIQLVRAVCKAAALDASVPVL